MTTVVILSADAGHVRACVGSVRERDPSVGIVVVDDGAGEPIPGVRWLAGVKPFVYARNANIGIEASGDDVILLNDDARLVTPVGFWRLAKQATVVDGLVSAAVSGYVANPHQREHWPARLRVSPLPLAFVAVYIPHSTQDAVGLLDERFVGYGYEDTDYCRRVTDAGMGMYVWDGCVVDHPRGESSYRSRTDWAAQYEQNRKIYEEKWHGFIRQP